MTTAHRQHNIDKEETPDLTDPRWNFLARVERLKRRGLSQEDAEEVVINVILTKE